MQYTVLSLTATPGVPHIFLPKTPAVIFLPDLELTLELRRTLAMDLILSRSIDFELDLSND